ncbi:MAG TPA: hypothetical protein VL356_13630 [Acidocella sp.]|jgi:hypothetical protein|nr:hypothetical protein [Acidocella sp.]
MYQKSYSFVLWAIPRFHRTGPARVVTATSRDSLSSERRVREEEKATTVAGKNKPRRAGGWRYALS